MENTSDISRKLKGSLEMACIRRELILYFLVMAAGILIAGASYGHAENAAFWIDVAVLFLVIFLPFVIFYLWRIICIWRERDQYILCRAVLSQPHQKMLLRTMYFTVVLEDPAGGKFSADTHAIFQCHGIIGPLVEDYINRTVTIAYNRETGMVVVIG